MCIRDRTLIFSDRTYNGSGMALIERCFEGEAVPMYAFLLKILFTAVALGAGFKGGEIVPTLCVGAVFGCTAGTDVYKRQEEIVHAEEEKEQLEKNVESRSSLKEEKASRQKAFFSRREELSERTGQLDKELYRLQGQKEKLEEKQENQINYMWNEYELTYSLSLIHILGAGLFNFTEKFVS